MIEGVQLTPLKRFGDHRGEVRHGLRATDPNFAGFGEMYFSTVLQGVVKGWKFHRRMHSNLIVIDGEIRFVLVDLRADSPTFGQKMDIRLSLDEYSRLTVPPEIWMAFQGVSSSTNLLVNIASIGHDPAESDTVLVDSPQTVKIGLPEIDWDLS